MENKNAYFEVQRTLKNSTSATEVSGIPVAERKQIVQNAQLIYPTVAEWVKEFPVILPQVVPSICLANSASGPDVAPVVVIQGTILSLLIFTIDSLADGAIGGLTDEQIEDLLTLCNEIVKSGGASYHNYPHLLKRLTASESAAWAQAANALAKCCQEIKAFPSASAYYQFFVKRFSLCMESWRVELHWRQAFEKTRAYPTYEQYLKNGKESIALPTLVAGYLAMVGQLPITSEFDCQPADSIETLLDEFVLTCGACVRLANDVRSFERERLEQKPNSILILMFEKGLTEEKAEWTVLKEIENYLEQAELMLTVLPNSLQPLGNCIKGLTWFFTEFYKVREFHDFSIEMLSDLASST